MLGGAGFVGRRKKGGLNDHGELYARYNGCGGSAHDGGRLLIIWDQEASCAGGV